VAAFDDRADFDADAFVDRRAAYRLVGGRGACQKAARDQTTDRLFHQTEYLRLAITFSHRNALR
jgi:hypothetical protein